MNRGGEVVKGEQSLSLLAQTAPFAQGSLMF